MTGTTKRFTTKVRTTRTRLAMACCSLALVAGGWVAGATQAADDGSTVHQTDVLADHGCGPLGGVPC